ncbi:hypothetical protein GBAR_LOCUS4630 [Geodia barretti]|uniref:Uncharacterized protein n=1 Tax=Geodia barretti TaxID=519541 RepID=A0AA35R7K8_GEOBA|nr:hypothetical protein GBAR_LOCUS4630 [Geodia barretti]
MSTRRLAFSHHDKGSIVIEIGRMYTKVGLSGEPAPRHVIRSRVEMKPYGAVRYHSDLYTIFNFTLIKHAGVYVVHTL